MDKPTQAQVDLESKIAFLERTCEELGEVILDQGKSLEQLLQRMGRVEARATASQELQDDEQSLADQKPPHY